MRRRSGRPGLLGTMARTAVIAGTANAVTTGMQRSAAEQQATKAAAAAAHQQQLVDQTAAQVTAALAQHPTVPARPAAATPPAAATAAPPSSGGSAAGDAGTGEYERLMALADLRRQGLLSEAEFTAAKAKLLGL